MRVTTAVDERVNEPEEELLRELERVTEAVMDLLRREVWLLLRVTDLEKEGDALKDGEPEGEPDALGVLLGGMTI